MNSETHFWGGVAVGLAIIAVQRPSIEVCVAGEALAIAGGEFPDWVSFYLPYIQIRYFEGHHSVINHSMWTIIGALVLIHHPFNIFFAAGIAVHLFLDLISGEGIPLLWPIIRHWVGFRITNNGKPGEFLVRRILVIFTIILILYIAYDWITIVTS